MATTGVSINCLLFKVSWCYDVLAGFAHILRTNRFESLIIKGNRSPEHLFLHVIFPISDTVWSVPSISFVISHVFFASVESCCILFVGYNHLFYLWIKINYFLLKFMLLNWVNKVGSRLSIHNSWLSRSGPNFKGPSHFKTKTKQCINSNECDCYCTRTL